MTHKVPPQAYLITLDIENFYTNISYEEAIKSLLKRLEHDPHKVFLLDRLKYVLKNNVFKFGDQVFTQLHGIAIRFTAEVNFHLCNFLDLTMYKSPQFLDTGLWSTEIYYKTTSTFCFPLGIHRYLYIVNRQ